jgi:hypothetical protein
MARIAIARVRSFELVLGAAALVACNSILGIDKYEPRPPDGGAMETGGTGATETGGTGEPSTGGAGDTSGEAGTSSLGGASATAGAGGSGGSSRGGSTASGGASGMTGGGASDEGGETNGGAGAGNTCADTLCSNQCVKLQTDGHNCGACGHDCQGGSCSTGRCESVQLATDKGRLFMVEVIGSDVYYGGDGVDVRRVGTDGTGDVALAPASDGPEYTNSWAVTPDALVWADAYNPTGVRGCSTPSCAGGPQHYEDASQRIQALAYSASASLLFFDEGSTLRAASWPGGTPSDFVTGQDNIVAATTDATSIYWETTDGLFTQVRSHDLVGGSTKALVTNWTGLPGSMSASPSFLFIAEQNSLYATPLPEGSGTEPPTLMGLATGSAKKVIATADRVYWTVAGGGFDGAGEVVSCPLGGCGPARASVLTMTTADPSGVTVADGVLYWVTETGEVAKIVL